MTRERTAAHAPDTGAADAMGPGGHAAPGMGEDAARSSVDAEGRASSRLQVGDATLPAAPAPDSPVAHRGGLSTLLKRPEFVAASRAQRWSMPGMVVQARRRAPAEPQEGARVGYTCSKKVGNAVARNRAKRRLRAAAAEALPGLARHGWDYVLIGRSEATAARPFPELVADLQASLSRLHEGKGRDSGPPRKGGHGRGKGKGKAGSKPAAPGRP